MTNWFMNYMPLQASQHAAEIDHMTVLVHWLMLIMFIGWGAFFMFVLVRFRKGANPTASYAGAKGKFAKGTEIVVAIIEIVLLVGYAIPAWATRVKPMPANNEAVIAVRVVGEQSSRGTCITRVRTGSSGRTDVHLVAADNPIGLDKNDADAKDDLTEINQLNVPVDRPVLVHLSSKDVIHSFGLYEMRIKQDAVPGLDIPLWFIPTVTTEEMRRKVGKPDFEYEIACSQLCGLGHYRMRGFVTVQSAADFKKWFDDQQREQHPPAAAPAAANP
jgi:cytochrome c oxidase subunit 2